MREPTQLIYPDIPRGQWVVQPRINKVSGLVAPTLMADRRVHWSYALYATQASLDRGDLPFLINSHKAMIRPNHMEIVITPAGMVEHESGILVPAADMEDFEDNDPRGHRWVSVSLTECVDDQGRTMRPFIFPTYWGVDEALDPQWKRRKFTLSQQSQILAFQELYFRGAEQRRLTGDRQGTTVDEIVGAGADDAKQKENGDFSGTSSAWRVGQRTALVVNSGARFQTVAIEGDIDAAYLTVNAADSSNPTEVLQDAFCEDIDDSPAYSDAAGVDVNSRNKTAGIAFDMSGFPGNSVDVNSPSMVTPFQAVVDRGGFASNNDLSVILDDGGSADARFISWKSYERSTTSCARIHVEFTEAAGPTGINQGVMRRRRESE